MALVQGKRSALDNVLAVSGAVNAFQRIVALSQCKTTIADLEIAFAAVSVSDNLIQKAPAKKYFVM